ncbi:hypothetical protein [Chitinimonas koreensis]|uniref:hypothetical protein n=1 Tax=Chitinimonas koreensis TaxID=356302 RepID=UPI001654BD11|nr:hypothetical protein [Chitinimonas koreensis]QNM97640.1 hypothetical protein H9L41_04890 [Chitinimonas koreensis]
MWNGVPWSEITSSSMPSSMPPDTIDGAPLPVPSPPAGSPASSRALSWLSACSRPATAAGRSVQVALTTAPWAQPVAGSTWLCWSVSWAPMRLLIMPLAILAEVRTTSAARKATPLKLAGDFQSLL